MYTECKTYLCLQWDSQVKDVPKMLHYAVEETRNIMVLELLGESLEGLFQLCKRQFSLKTVLMLAHQMIKRLQFIHGKRILHRDIKPQNFAMGRKATKKRVYLIDFGLSKKFLSPTGKHISYKEGGHLVGTARYSSLNTHLGNEQSRRDDMESLGYMFIYFMKGKLPWQYLKGKENYSKIRDLKKLTSVEDLCQGMPSAFHQYF